MDFSSKLKGFCESGSLQNLKENYTPIVTKNIRKTRIFPVLIQNNVCLPNNII